jgi:hypothetical protein
VRGAIGAELAKRGDCPHTHAGGVARGERAASEEKAITGESLGSLWRGRGLVPWLYLRPGHGSSPSTGRSFARWGSSPGSHRPCSRFRSCSGCTAEQDWVRRARKGIVVVIELYQACTEAQDGVDLLLRTNGIAASQNRQRLISCTGAMQKAVQEAQRHLEADADLHGVMECSSRVYHQVSVMHDLLEEFCTRYSEHYRV